MNRLGSATSPYLLQHVDNPVHWWPWGEEAFAEARRRDVPLLISIGYAACHWCHVMAHESFEDVEVAKVVNSAVVPVKVDREERPDVDAVYMSATQAMMNGHGGWPMTVFATPDGAPFLCGTYYPRDTFMRVVHAVSQAWDEQRDLVIAQGAAVVEAVARLHGPASSGPAADGTGTAAGGPGAAAGATGSITPQMLDTAAAALRREHDQIHGGFGHAPKFPPHLALLFLLRQHQRAGDHESLEIARHTCEAMARGGLYDQVGGGFARYSVDERWLVPHFEKMLYDNALLLRLYTLLWRLTGDALAGRIAAETAAFLIDEMAAGTGGFISSLDADTAGVEGATYVWTPAQLVEALGPDDGAFAADLFGVTPGGTFEHGTSVLTLSRDIDAADEAVRRRWAEVRARLAVLRRTRPQPGRDAKVVAAWNGLAITGLVEFAVTAEALAPTGTTTADGVPVAESARRAAVAAAAYLLDRHLVDGRLRRVSLGGAVGAPAGVLEDYGCVAEALCAVHQLTGEARWLDAAGRLLDPAVAHFADGTGGFFDTADDAERLVVRPADPTDNATPSGLTSIAAALVAYTALTGETRYREVAVRALETIGTVMARHPRFVGYGCAAAEALLSGPYEIAVADSTGESALARAAWRLAPPGAVVVVGAPDRVGVPLLRDRPMIDGRPTAYVCRGFVCDRPVSTVEELAALLAR
jgi:uncharacterized protein YyaL (SSP411 family)